MRLTSSDVKIRPQISRPRPSLIFQGHGHDCNLQGQCEGHDLQDKAKQILHLFTLKSVNIAYSQSVSQSVMLTDSHRLQCASLSSTLYSD